MLAGGRARKRGKKRHKCSRDGICEWCRELWEKVIMSGMQWSRVYIVRGRQWWEGDLLHIFDTKVASRTVTELNLLSFSYRATRTAPSQPSFFDWATRTQSSQPVWNDPNQQLKHTMEIETSAGRTVCIQHSNHPIQKLTEENVVELRFTKNKEFSMGFTDIKTFTNSGLLHFICENMMTITWLMEIAKQVQGQIYRSGQLFSFWTLSDIG